MTQYGETPTHPIARYEPSGWLMGRASRKKYPPEFNFMSSISISIQGILIESSLDKGLSKL